MFPLTYLHYYKISQTCHKTVKHKKILFQDIQCMEFHKKCEIHFSDLYISPETNFISVEIYPNR
jgi:hypothetical protein